MACFSPLTGFYGRELTRNGKRRLVFPETEWGQRQAAMVSGGEVFDIPCGKCEGCLLRRAQEYALRCEQEASLWASNVFVTLTYRECPLFAGVPSLRRRDFVLFMKRLRKRRAGVVRYVVAGEYGKLGRPHYHALLFNCGFPDKVLLRKRATGDLYRSPELESLWDLGYSSLGEVTYESAAYVARYTLKKVAEVGRPAVVEVPGRERMFMSMSLKPGIGAGWLKKFRGDVFPWDEVVGRGGRVFRPPRYYDSLYEREDPEGFAKVKAKRESPPDGDGYARVVNGKLYTRLSARREVVRSRIRDRMRREL